jgi:hypothetical protein
MPPSSARDITTTTEIMILLWPDTCKVTRLDLPEVSTRTGTLLEIQFNVTIHLALRIAGMRQAAFQMSLRRRFQFPEMEVRPS